MVKSTLCVLVAVCCLACIMLPPAAEARRTTLDVSMGERSKASVFDGRGLLGKEQEKDEKKKGGDGKKKKKGAKAKKGSKGKKGKEGSKASMKAMRAAEAKSKVTTLMAKIAGLGGATCEHFKKALLKPFCELTPSVAMKLSVVAKGIEKKCLDCDSPGYRLGVGRPGDLAKCIGGMIEGFTHVEGINKCRGSGTSGHHQTKWT